MTIGPASPAEPSGAQALMMGAAIRPSKLIAPNDLHWNGIWINFPCWCCRDAIACGHYLYDLSKKRGNVDGVADGDACARYRGCTKTGEPVIRETVAGTWANYHAGQIRARSRSPSSFHLNLNLLDLVTSAFTCRLDNTVQRVESTWFSVKRAPDF